MKTLSTGEPSTLGTYRKWAKIFGEECVDFFDKKIEEAPNGEDEEVIQDETQMLFLMANIGRAK